MSEPILPPAMAQIVEQLSGSPSLPLIVEQFETILQAEREKRQHFYDTIAESDKAEFINGEIVMQSPVKLRQSRASQSLFSLLMAFVEKHQLGYVGHEKLLITLTRNDYEPDICFFSENKALPFTPNQMKFPPPDLAVEVLSDSTADKDRGIKFEDYALHGVGEYWIIDAVSEMVAQYRLEKGTYTLALKAKTGLIESVEVKGFSIPIRAIFDRAEYVKALQEIMQA